MSIIYNKFVTVIDTISTNNLLVGGKFNYSDNKEIAEDLLIF